MVMIYLHTKFHMPNSNGSLVIGIKHKIKYTHRYHRAAMLLVLRSTKKLKKISIFSVSSMAQYSYWIREKFNHWFRS
jgi:hypothetical protein